MMDYTELKKLAEAAPSGPWEVARFMAAASPDIVLGLIAQVEALKADAERGRYMIMNGCWHRGEEQTHLAVLVPQGSDLSCYAMREAAIDAARSK